MMAQSKYWWNRRNNPTLRAVWCSQVYVCFKCFKYYCKHLGYIRTRVMLKRDYFVNVQLNLCIIFIWTSYSCYVWGIFYEIIVFFFVLNVDVRTSILQYFAISIQVAYECSCILNLCTYSRFTGSFSNR